MPEKKSVEVFASRVDAKNERGVFALLLKSGFSPEDYSVEVKHIISAVRQVEDLLLLQDNPEQILDADVLAHLIGKKISIYKDIDNFDADFLARSVAFEKSICDQYARDRLNAAAKIHRLREERKK